MIINSASDWSTGKSTIVFYAENSHVHSRRKIPSYFLAKVRSRAACIRSYFTIICRLHYSLVCHQHNAAKCNDQQQKLTKRSYVSRTIAHTLNTDLTHYSMLSETLHKNDFTRLFVRITQNKPTHASSLTHFKLHSTINRLTQLKVLPLNLPLTHSRLFKQFRNKRYSDVSYESHALLAIPQCLNYTFVILIYSINAQNIIRKTL